jgi:hypothetical protein
VVALAALGALEPDDESDLDFEPDPEPEAEPEPEPEPESEPELEPGSAIGVELDPAFSVEDDELDSVESALAAAFVRATEPRSFLAQPLPL